MLVGEGSSAQPDHPTPSGRSTARSLEESFIVLDSSATVGGAHAPAPASEAPADILTAQIRSLTAIYELASTETQVDQPLCMDCAKALYSELKVQLQEAEREIAAYRDAVQELKQSYPISLAQYAPPAGRALGVYGGDARTSVPSTDSTEGGGDSEGDREGQPGSAEPPSASTPPRAMSSKTPPALSPVHSDPKAALKEELQQLLTEEQKEQKRLAALEREYGSALDELRTLEAESLRLDQLEDAYWRELNRWVIRCLFLYF